MINEMTDEARDEAFARTKSNALDMIFGDKQVPIPSNEPEKNVIDFKFGTNANWLDQTRITAKLNNDMNGIRQNFGYHEKRVYVMSRENHASNAELKNLEEHFNNLKLA